MPATFKCPKCGQSCERCGEVTEGGSRLDVYQCENEACQVSFEMEGESFPAAYTFVVGPDRVARDPVEPFDVLSN